jgi:predicted MFS family arabinose efflux permease
MTGLLVLAGVTVAVALPSFRQPAFVVAAFFVGVAAQGLKVSVDALVQAEVDDTFRGRVFTVYDVVFNVAFVLAAMLTAVVIPLDGESQAVVAGVAAGYLALAWWYRRRGGEPA